MNRALLLVGLITVLAVLFVVLSSSQLASAEVSFADATTSAEPPTSPQSFIITGFNPPFSTPRSIEIHWPLPTDIGAASGTFTFSFWGRINFGEPKTRILVNGLDAGQVPASASYNWLSVTFPTSYLDQGSNNVIEIWTETNDLLRVAADGPGVDDVGAQNAVFIRNNGGTSGDSGTNFIGQIYARLTNEKSAPVGGISLDSDLRPLPVETTQP